jgi:hypothetical protein
MSDHTGDFRVTVESPHGKRAVESFRHFLGKVADDAQERWGIDIQISRIEDDELPENGGFDE